MYAHRMTAFRQSPPANCSEDCSRCGISLVAKQTPDDARVDGWRLVWRASAVFLLPLGGAVAGARLMSQPPLMQLAGAGMGFGVSVAVAMLLTRLLKV